VLKIILLLAYLLGGELKVEQKVFNSPEDCETAGHKRIAALKTDTEFEQGIVAVCVPAIVKGA
jgi:hypothetical protein